MSIYHDKSFFEDFGRRFQQSTQNSNAYASINQSGNSNLQESSGNPNDTSGAGTIPGGPNVSSLAESTDSGINIQILPQGFGAYLDGIIPTDIATAAGAFSASMQQIKNISSIPIEKFSQVVASIETTKNLNVNGTTVPTDTTLAQEGLALIALGSGPHGTYTMSNFLGCMSGLPYLGLNIQELITDLETPALYSIYEQIYLLVTSAIGWPGNNSLIQTQIDLANQEILNIKNANSAKAQKLITNWETTGTQLSIEQRAIASGLPIGVPNDVDHEREPTIAAFPTTQYSFIDAIPQYATFTQPHMYSQTLEAIADYSTLGGRSIVAMLRQARNQDRLAKIGVPLDNNISDILPKVEESDLIANGVLPGTIPATLEVDLGDGVTTSTNPYGYYNPIDDTYYVTNQEFGGNGAPLDTGQADEPGSFAGSRYQNLISPELSPIFASRDLLPSTYTIQEAIDEVIRCNCDCWDNM